MGCGDDMDVNEQRILSLELELIRVYEFLYEMKNIIYAQKLQIDNLTDTVHQIKVHKQIFDNIHGYN